MKNIKNKKWFIPVASVFLVILAFSSFYFKNNILHAQTNKTEASSPNPAEEKIDDLINSANLFGTIAVVKNGNFVYTNSYGLSNKDKNIKNTTDTIYPIASLQKNMTAVIIAQLIDEGKLTYDTTLTDFYPDLEHADEITIRQLIDHTSGYTMPEVSTGKVLTTEKEQLGNALETSVFQDNHDYNYSNGNYSLLAGIIKDLDDMPYEESLQKRILDPLKMKDTYLWNHLPKNRNIPTEYYYKDNSDYVTDGTVYSEELMSTLLGAGNLYSTAKDVATFEMSLNNGTLLKDEEYLELLDIEHNQLVERTGNISSENTRGGYSSYLYGDITNQNIVVFLSNQSSEEYPEQLMANIYEQLLLL